MNGIQYIIDEKNRTIVCRLYGCNNIAENRVYKYTKTLAFHFKELNIPYEFCGVAHCSKEDKFDVEYGKKLALTRAKRKRGQAINNAIKNYIDKVRRELDVLEKYGIHEVPEVERC